MSAPIAWSNAVRRPRLRLPIIDAWIITAALAFFALLFIALFGARIAPHEPIYFVVEHGSDRRPYDPGIVFPFGSDVLGRDILSLVLAGAGTTITIALAGGIARVAAGLVLAAVGGWWRPLRLVTESVAELVSAIPATLVALVVVKILVKADTTILVFVGALLLIGWAGPYRVVRAEIDRLQHAPFTIGARALGVAGRRLFWRHQLPHLVPVLAMNLAQQTVASLVLVAELGVLGAFVGTTRLIGIEESLSRVVTGPVTFAQIADPPEWGGLLASARTIESLWTTRWLIFVPGVAFALAAVLVATIGFALARRYAQRDVVDDLRRRGAAAFALAIVALAVVAGLVPNRYAAAAEWASGARAAVRSTADTATAFAAAGLVPLANEYAVNREINSVVQTAPSTVQVGATNLSEKWPWSTTSRTFGGDVRSFVTAGTGGGRVEAPLVFAGRGIVPSENRPPEFRTLIGLQLPDLGTLIKDYADDYAGLDVRGKVVMVVRFHGFRHETFDANGRPKFQQTVQGMPVEDTVAGAIKRGAAAVLLVDPDLPSYTDIITSPPYGPFNAYLRSERDSPPTTTGGVPVVVLSGTAAVSIAAPLGLDVARLYGYDTYGKFDHQASLSRELGVNARVEVPIARREQRATSYGGEVRGAPASAPHVLVWAPRDVAGGRASADVLAAVAASVAPRGAPFIFVDFDPSIDPRANAEAVTKIIREQRIALVVILKDLRGSALKFDTPWGDLIPAFDLYATRADARAIVTRETAPMTLLSGGAPFVDIKTVLISGNGEGDADLRGDAAALLGYLAGRYALGAEELPR